MKVKHECNYFTLYVKSEIKNLLFHLHHMKRIERVNKALLALREICGTCCDLLCSVVQNALWVFEFKLIKSIS